MQSLTGFVLFNPRSSALLTTERYLESEFENDRISLGVIFFMDRDAAMAYLRDGKAAEQFGKHVPIPASLNFEKPTHPAGGPAERSSNE